MSVVGSVLRPVRRVLAEMSEDAWFGHLDVCEACRDYRQHPCEKGKELFARYANLALGFSVVIP